MYVRDAKNRDEVWLLDHIEAMGLDDTAFRSRDYVIAMDEESSEKAGFGRFRVHKTDDGDLCELTSIGVLPDWRDQGVGAHVIERLVSTAADEGFDEVYSLTGEPDYLAQFGFERIDVTRLPERLHERLEAKQDSLEPDAVPMVIETGTFSMPGHLREAFKGARPGDEDDEPEEGPEDFGIDPDQATYKYDTGQ